MRRTDGRAFTCCRSSAAASASRPSDDEIRDLIVALGALPAGHPLARLLREAPDFRQEAALADALLHPQDRAYSVPQLLDFIAGAGLTFSRWVRQAPYSPHCGVMARLPQASRIAALEPAQQYAAAELFRGAMMSHSVIVRRDDRPGRSAAIGFSGDAWLDYVPVRVPDTLCVQERLPPGAAAVLINRAHTDTDIYVPIDAREKRLVDAIDGERSIGEIAGDEQRDLCRAPVRAALVARSGRVRQVAPPVRARDHRAATRTDSARHHGFQRQKMVNAASGAVSGRLS